jgi:hypothetical protein
MTIGRPLVGIRYDSCDQTRCSLQSDESFDLLLRLASRVFDKGCRRWAQKIAKHSPRFTQGKDKSKRDKLIQLDRQALDIEEIYQTIDPSGISLEIRGIPRAQPITRHRTVLRQHRPPCGSASDDDIAFESFST